jgi:RNA polymerase sigma factor (sigma-70 family)
MDTTLASATVFIVDDDPAMRDSMSFLVRSVGMAVETYSGAQEFLDAYDPQRPGCLVFDVRMPGMSGLELQEFLSERGIRSPVVMVTGYGDVPMAVRALKGGAVDFLEKPFTDQELLETINEATDRDHRQRTKEAELSKVKERISRLTPREREVMDLVLDGKPNKVIAAELGLSPKTVEVHRSRVMAKMQVGSLAVLLQTVLSYRMSGSTPDGPDAPAPGSPQ